MAKPGRKIEIVNDIRLILRRGELPLEVIETRYVAARPKVQTARKSFRVCLKKHQAALDEAFEMTPTGWKIKHSNTQQSPKFWPSFGELGVGSFIMSLRSDNPLNHAHPFAEFLRMRQALRLALDENTQLAEYCLGDVFPEPEGESAKDLRKDVCDPIRKLTGLVINRNNGSGEDTAGQLRNLAETAPWWVRSVALTILSFIRRDQLRGKTLDEKAALIRRSQLELDDALGFAASTDRTDLISDVILVMCSFINNDALAQMRANPKADVKKLGSNSVALLDAHEQLGEVEGFAFRQAVIRRQEHFIFAYADLQNMTEKAKPYAEKLLDLGMGRSPASTLAVFRVFARLSDAKSQEIANQMRKEIAENGTELTKSITTKLQERINLERQIHECR